MFDNTGEKLQLSAKILFWIEITATVLSVLIGTWDSSAVTALLGLIILPVIILIAYVKCLFLIVIADIWDSVVK